MAKYSFVLDLFVFYIYIYNIYNNLSVGFLLITCFPVSHIYKNRNLGCWPAESEWLSKHNLPVSASVNRLCGLCWFPSFPPLLTVWMTFALGNLSRFVYANLCCVLPAGRLVCLACSSDDQLLLPSAQIPRCVRQHYHLRVGHLPLLPQTQSKWATQ